MKFWLCLLPLLCLLSCGDDDRSTVSGEKTVEAPNGSDSTRMQPIDLPYWLNSGEYEQHELVVKYQAADTSFLFYDMGPDSPRERIFQPTDDLRLFSYATDSALPKTARVGAYTVMVFESIESQKATPFIGVWQGVGDSLGLRQIFVEPELGRGQTGLMEVIERPNDLIIVGKTLYGYSGSAIGNHWVARYDKTAETLTLLDSDSFAYRNNKTISKQFRLNADSTRLLVTQFRVDSVGATPREVAQSRIDLD